MQTESKHLEHALGRAGLRFSCTYAGERIRDAGKGERAWQCDAWTVRIDSNVKGAEPYVFEFYTGLGLRRPRSKPPKWFNPRVDSDALGRYTPRPVAPTVDDVLNSLMLDRMAAYTSFSDWCAEYGYDDDSIKAFELYRQCCDVNDRLQKLRVVWHEIWQAVEASANGVQPDDENQLQLDLEE